MDIRLETDRLILRRYREDDFDVYAAMQADPEVARFLGGVRDLAGAREHFDKAQAHWRSKGYGKFAVEEKASGLMVGRVGPTLHGDEPEIEPGYIDRLIALQAKTGAFASTLACPFPADATAGPGSPEDPSAVKAILGAKIADDAYWARYFTRHQAVWPRDEAGRIIQPQDYYLHIGVYAFSKASLMDFAAAPAGALEKIERLEQLRILERGGEIALELIPQAAPGIDTPEDYEAFVRRAGKGAA